MALTGTFSECGLILTEAYLKITEYTHIIDSGTMWFRYKIWANKQAHDTLRGSVFQGLPTMAVEDEDSEGDELVSDCTWDDYNRILHDGELDLKIGDWVGSGNDWFKVEEVGSKVIFIKNNLKKQGPVVLRRKKLDTCKHLEYFGIESLTEKHPIFLCEEFLLKETELFVEWTRV